jgi:predicted secreted protein
VELHVGETTTVRLAGRGTAGYRWTAVVSSDAVSVSVSPAPGGRSLPGSASDEIATIEARHPGEATVTLEQRRSWENRAEPVDRHVLKITVA